jgi:hypothetical protein
VLAAFFMRHETLLKMVLIEFATFGMVAPAATATNPAINAYSIRSWPRSLRQISNRQINRLIHTGLTGRWIFGILEAH